MKWLEVVTAVKEAHEANEVQVSRLPRYEMLREDLVIAPGLNRIVDGKDAEERLRQLDPFATVEMMEWVKALPEHELQAVLTRFHERFSELVRGSPGLYDKFAPLQGERLKGDEIAEMLVDYVGELAERRSPEFLGFAKLHKEHEDLKIEHARVRARANHLQREVESLRQWKAQVQKGFEDRMAELRPGSKES